MQNTSESLIESALKALKMARAWVSDTNKEANYIDKVIAAMGDACSVAGGGEKSASVRTIPHQTDTLNQEPKP